MKAKLDEYEGCFSVTLEPETMEEMARLVRFGMNRTSDLRSASVQAYSDGTVYGRITIGKSKRSNSLVPRR